MSDVYFKKINSNTPVTEIQKITKELLKAIVSKENIELQKIVPLKVHLGEQKNITFLKSDNYEGIIDYLKQSSIETCYMETSVLYGGYRNSREAHKKTAEKHGFNQIPVVFADGEHGELYSEVKIDKNYFTTCKLGKEFDSYSQYIVLSHFKGHILAGFGGAIKQLSMGFASKGGKLAMHMGIKPKIMKWKCKKCNLCQTRCAENAITIGKSPFIDHNKCVGCGACISICPHKAIAKHTLKGIFNLLQGKKFREKLAEYAYAAHTGRKNIYINFAMNITKGCDCEPRKMKPIMDDFGIYISTDPVAIDSACYDAVKERGKAFRGHAQLSYAESIGLGSTKYNLIEL